MLGGLHIGRKSENDEVPEVGTAHGSKLGRVAVNRRAVIHFDCDMSDNRLHKRLSSDTLQCLCSDMLHSASDSRISPEIARNGNLCERAMRTVHQVVFSGGF